MGRPLPLPPSENTETRLSRQSSLLAGHPHFLGGSPTALPSLLLEKTEAARSLSTSVSFAHTCSVIFQNHPGIWV